MRKILLLLAVLVLVAGCGNVEGSVSTPGFLPVSASITVSDHKVEFKGEVSMATPLGEVSIGVTIGEPIDDDKIRVVFRDHHRLGGTDQVFDVRTGGDEFEAVLDGRTVVTVRDHQVVIDITDSSVTEVRFRPTEASARAGQGWWATTFYHPFDLFDWAYSDATMTDWPPLGFIWFLVRLVFALLLAVLDVYLTLVFVLAWLVSLVGGNTGGNITVGLCALVTIFAIGAFVTSA
ncbi:hypothetical protein [Actinokineospora inagensis]|uniref:hypothetical protein n=1 Tax=Actinokineospora inagensis TaxID=103730 RepID=UPI00047C457F|nr:hypothetical protein [Actinokineospora inagensis]